MKLLENTKFESIVSTICKDIDYLEFGLECYSCKMMTEEKKRFKKSINNNQINEAPTYTAFLNKRLADSYSPNSSLEPSPKTLSIYNSHINNNTAKISTALPDSKVIFYLKSVLNIHYNDYDFNGATFKNFYYIPDYQNVVDNINSRLCSAFGTDLNQSLISLIWKEIDEEVTINRCEIYKYEPDIDNDPLAHENLFPWSFILFLFNRKSNRLVFFYLHSSCPKNSESFEFNQESSEIFQISDNDSK